MDINDLGYNSDFEQFRIENGLSGFTVGRIVAEQVFLKAVAEGEIVGSVRAFFDGRTCFIGKLIVKTDFQNQGIGKLLLDSLESAFTMCKRFELFTWHKSLKNLHLYNKLGCNEFSQKVINDNMTMIYLGKIR